MHLSSFDSTFVTKVSFQFLEGLKSRKIFSAAGPAGEVGKKVRDGGRFVHLCRLIGAYKCS